jgi:hypothetical protein
MRPYGLQSILANSEASKELSRFGFGLTHRKIFSFVSFGRGALFPPSFLRRERAIDMHSTTPNTRSYLPLVELPVTLWMESIRAVELRVHFFWQE